MQSIASLFIAGWQRVASQSAALYDDLPADRWADQPGGVVNHPAWTLAHLAHYHPAILSLLRGQPVADPAKAPHADRYDEGSTPVADVTAYPSKADLWRQYQQGHAAALTALHEVTPAILQQPPGLPRWARAFATSADALTYLMLLHESQHLGQVMVWRRAASLAR